LDTNIIYGKIQTNRASLKKYMDVFTKHKTGEETCISPRPKPGKAQIFYIAILKFPEETVNRRYFTKMKNFTELSKEAYEAEIGAVEYSWEA